MPTRPSRRAEVKLTGPARAPDIVGNPVINYQIAISSSRSARRAERAEANAADAIDFAGWAVDEAEAEALEAAEARKIADALKPSTPSSTGPNTGHQLTVGSGDPVLMSETWRQGQSPPRPRRAATRHPALVHVRLVSRASRQARRPVS